MNNDQETRTVNLELTIQKAKKWFNKGGELKTLALKAFTKKELTQKVTKKQEETVEQNTQPTCEVEKTNSPIGDTISVPELKTFAYIIGVDDSGEANAYITRKFLIGNKLKCSWQDAMKLDRTLPGGWHVPTDSELESLYDVLSDIGVDANGIWTTNDRNGIIERTTGEQKDVRAIFFK